MNEKGRPVLAFVGIVLLLVGLYGSLRTVVNLLAFERYPQERVFNWSFAKPEYTAPIQREEDCASTYIPPLYYKADNITTRPATPEETAYDQVYKQQQEETARNCVKGIGEARKQTMVADISQSLIFLLLAFGVLFYTRVFKTPITLKI